jgi:hypothetical protein
MTNVKRLPRWMSDEECKALLKWLEGLEIGEVAELKRLYDSKPRQRLRRAWLALFDLDPK